MASCILWFGSDVDIVVTHSIGSGELHRGPCLVIIRVELALFDDGLKSRFLLLWWVFVLLEESLDHAAHVGAGGFFLSPVDGLAAA